MASPGRCSVVLAIAVFLAAACSTVKETVKTAREMPSRPRTTQTVAVSDVSERAGCLEATLATEVPLRFYFSAASESCRALLVDGSQVEYRGGGAFGEVAGSAGDCLAEGTACLRKWHDRQSRRMVHGKARVIARFQKTYEDDSVLVIRGRLPLATVLGLIADDLVAILPARAECRAVAESGEAFMNYERSVGPVFSLTSAETRCEFLGLAQPLRN